MTALRGLPPGRAGRIWLRRRLQAAAHAASLLDRKLRILEVEQERFARRCEEADASWAAALADADAWALRASLLGGAHSFDALHDGRSARIELTWAALMGARYPSSGRLVLPETPGATAALPASSAVDEAARAYGLAAQLAVEAAVARCAVQVVRAEVAATRFRKRAIEDRWMPRLTEAAAVLDLELSEAESAEGVAMRRAVRTSALGQRER